MAGTNTTEMPSSYRVNRARGSSTDKSYRKHRKLQQISTESTQSYSNSETEKPTITECYTYQVEYPDSPDESEEVVDVYYSQENRPRGHYKPRRRGQNYNRGNRATIGNMNYRKGSSSYNNKSYHQRGSLQRRNQQYQQSAKPKFLKGINCHYCQKEGHVIRECRKRKFQGMTRDKRKEKPGQ